MRKVIAILCVVELLLAGLLVYRDVTAQRNYWNNGVCRCGGHYTISDWICINGSWRYSLICNQCGTPLELTRVFLDLP